MQEEPLQAAREMDGFQIFHPTRMGPGPAWTQILSPRALGTFRWMPQSHRYVFRL